MLLDKSKLHLVNREHQRGLTVRKLVMLHQSSSKSDLHWARHNFGLVPILNWGTSIWCNGKQAGVARSIKSE